MDSRNQSRNLTNKVTVLVLLEAFSCVDQPRSLSISQVRPNQESGTGGRQVLLQPSRVFQQTLGTSFLARCNEEQVGANGDTGRRPWMAKVSTEL